jgi:hypothetical protein
MSDTDRDELLLNIAFEEFTTGSTPKITAGRDGTAAIRRRVARRRRFRLIVAVLVVLAVGVPAGIWAASRWGGDRASGASRTQATRSPAPVPSATGLTAADLAGAELPPCSGRSFDEFVEANLDGDPELEWAVLVHCGSAAQVIAVEKPASGPVRVLGLIVATQDITAIARRTKAGEGVLITSHDGEQGYAWNGHHFVRID